MFRNRYVDSDYAAACCDVRASRALLEPWYFG
jgi:hypothetical protein